MYNTNGKPNDNKNICQCFAFKNLSILFCFKSYYFFANLLNFIKQRLLGINNICEKRLVHSYISQKYFFLKYNATLTSAIITGTSTNGPITAAKATPN